jgi:small subunit ribosomal protein S15e
MEVLHARARRKLTRGLKRKPQALLKKLRKAKKECGPLEKPEVVKTHLRDMIVLPEMVGSVVGVYNGKTFNQVEIKVSILLLLSGGCFTAGA